jgi:hypothetical protein
MPPRESEVVCMLRIAYDMYGQDLEVGQRRQMRDNLE